MDDKVQKYQCAIIGGGLAGLCLSIQLADRGISVVLFEKNQYPFHKVCGEYISMESWDFLTRLGLKMGDLSLPLINELGITSEKGFMLNHRLSMGGFGISRYSLDYYLSQIAKSKGVQVVEKCKVTLVADQDETTHEIHTAAGKYQAEIVCGSYGRYTPAFVDYQIDSKKGGGNYIGVKYHIRTDLKPDRIELHNFKDGYCGVSKVDKDWHCLCYLATAKTLTENGKDIRRMEENVLYKNPHLKRYFEESEFVRKDPLVISNIQFSKKYTDANGMFLLGDAAGSITPLCGNGMSMGMRGSFLLSRELVGFFEHKHKKRQAMLNYQKAWNNAFNARITSGYYIQHLFGKRNTTDIALKLLSVFPSVTTRLISLTHGDVF